MKNTQNFTSLIKKDELNTLLVEAEKIEVPNFTEIQETIKETSGLKASSFDKKELDAIHSGEMKQKNNRLKIQKLAKMFKDFLNKSKSDVIENEKKILEDIIKEETRLKEEKQKIKDKIEQDKLEKERLEAERIEKIQKQYLEYGVEISIFDLKLKSDADIKKELEEAKIEFEKKELERIEKEKIELFEKTINSFKNEIINAKTLDEINGIECKISDIPEITDEIYNQEFAQTIKQKLEMISFEENKKKMEAEKAELEAEKARLAEEKKKAEQEKIDKENAEKAKKEKEELEKLAKQKAEKVEENTTKYIEDIKDCDLEYFKKFSYPVGGDYNISRLKTFIDGKISELELEAKREQEKIQEQKKLEAQKKYKDFLFNNSVTKEDIEAGVFILKEVDGVINLYKKIDSFKK